MKMKNRIKRDIETFLWYKDYRKEIKELIKYGDEFYNKLKFVPSPFLNHEYNDFIQFLWTVFVINYGDYGVCPIYGWVDEWEIVREFLEDVCNHYEEV